MNQDNIGKFSFCNITPDQHDMNREVVPAPPPTLHPSVVTHAPALLAQS